MPSLPDSLREAVSERAGHRCEYCLTERRVIGLPLVTDHILPRALGGTHIIGLTPTGRATVIALRLNNEYIVEARALWVARDWHPPPS